MKIKIEADVKEIEMAIFILGQAIESAKTNENFRKAFDIDADDIDDAVKFEKALTQAFLNG